MISNKARPFIKFLLFLLLALVYNNFYANQVNKLEKSIKSIGLNKPRSKPFKQSGDENKNKEEIEDELEEEDDNNNIETYRFELSSNNSCVYFDTYCLPKHFYTFLLSLGNKLYILYSVFRI